MIEKESSQPVAGFSICLIGCGGPGVCSTRRIYNFKNWDYHWSSRGIFTASAKVAQGRKFSNSE